MLPIELLTFVIGCCENPILYHLLSVNSVFYTLASRQLYRELYLDSQTHWPDLVLDTLAKNRELAALVRVFVVNIMDFSNDNYQCYTSAFLREVHHALGNMVNLEEVHFTSHDIRRPIPHKNFDHFFAAFKSRSIMSFYTETDIRRSVLTLVAQQESLTMLALVGNLVDEAALIEVLQDAKSLPNLKYIQARPHTLQLLIKYRMVKKIIVDYDSVDREDDNNDASELTGVISERCPENLEIAGFIKLPEWLQVLEAMAFHGPTVKSHAVGLYWLKDIEDDDQIWEQIGSNLKKLTTLHYLDMWAEDFDEASKTWKRLEAVCMASSPSLLGLWTPGGYLERSSVMASWPAQPQQFARCHSCFTAQSEISPAPTGCYCERT